MKKCKIIKTIMANAPPEFNWGRGLDLSWVGISEYQVSDEWFNGFLASLDKRTRNYKIAHGYAKGVMIAGRATVLKQGKGYHWSECVAQVCYVASYLTFIKMLEAGIDIVNRPPFIFDTSYGPDPRRAAFKALANKRA